MMAREKHIRYNLWDSSFQYPGSVPTLDFNVNVWPHDIGSGPQIEEAWETAIPDLISVFCSDRKLGGDNLICYWFILTSVSYLRPRLSHNHDQPAHCAAKRPQLYGWLFSFAFQVLNCVNGNISVKLQINQLAMKKKDCIISSLL